MTLDRSFQTDVHGLARALSLLEERPDANPLPSEWPEVGIGEEAVLEALAGPVLGGAADLAAPTSLAHMDPPTPWIAWAMTLWNAALNQNLLHPAVSPTARRAEEQVIEWLAPVFGMEGGHFCAGSTLANLTALWAARDVAGARRVVASASAHISIEKSARILGMEFQALPPDAEERIDADALVDLAETCLVLTAGTTSTGAIDLLLAGKDAAWRHVDAAWSGALRLTCHANLLEGIERADSIAISAHKWFFQPKDSAIVLFRDAANANESISFGGGYLSNPNVGIQGSRGAAAIPLMATLLAWGRAGLAERIERAMALAADLANWIDMEPRLELWRPPVSAVVNFRPRFNAAVSFHPLVDEGVISTCTIAGEPWFRIVVANPNACVDLIIERLQAALTGYTASDQHHL